MRKLVACLFAVLLAAPTAGAVQIAESTEARAALVAALERLIATGEPPRTSHDEGQVLQLAVTEAINSGDRKIERLAIRATSPLVATVSTPVSSTLALPSIEVLSRQALQVPRPVPFEATIYVAANGGDFAEVGKVVSGKGWGARIDTVLNAAAITPGFHHLRVRAHLTFQRPDGVHWTEVRDLPDIAYALFNPESPASDGAAALLRAPVTASARSFDAALPDVPFGVWLTQLLNAGDPSGKRKPDWSSQYCSERTRDHGRPPRSGAVCAVAWFEIAGEIFRAWFRTGTVRLTEAGPRWTVAPPTLEGINAARSGTEASSLSALVELVATPRESWPTGDVAIAPEDIAISLPDPARGQLATVTITVRNHGLVDLHAVEVSYTVAADAARRTEWRVAAVDVPRRGTAVVRFEAAFPAGYGFVVAHATHRSDASPYDTFTFDPTPQDACAFRIVNADRAPAGYMRTLGDTSGCRGW